MRARGSKDAKGRSPHRAGGQRERGLWLLFLCFSVPESVLCKLGQPGVLLFVLPEVLTSVLRPSFVLFSRAFPSRSFSHRHFGLFFPILTTWQNYVPFNPQITFCVCVCVCVCWNHKSNREQKSLIWHFFTMAAREKQQQQTNKPVSKFPLTIWKNYPTSAHKPECSHTEDWAGPVWKNRDLTQKWQWEQ